MNWTAEQLLGEIAAIRVRLENDRVDDALYMCSQIISDDDEIYNLAREEYSDVQTGEPFSQEVSQVIGYSHWYIANQPILDEKGDPKPFSFNDLVRDFHLNSFATFWHESVNPDGDDVLICGIDPMAEIYYVTKHAGIEGQVVFVRDADDKIDQINRDQLPYFKENMT